VPCGACEALSGAAALPCSRRHSRQPLGPSARPCRSQRARIPELTAQDVLEHECYRAETACPWCPTLPSRRVCCRRPTGVARLLCLILLPETRMPLAAV